MLVIRQQRSQVLEDQISYCNMYHSPKKRIQTTDAIYTNADDLSECSEWRAVRTPTAARASPTLKVMSE